VWEFDEYASGLLLGVLFVSGIEGEEAACFSFRAFQYP